MSEFDKGRIERKKKKSFTMNKDKDDSGPLGGGRFPIILAKPDREKDWDRSDRERSTDARSPAKATDRPLSQPTIILRTREGESRAVSPSQRPPSVLRKDADAPQPIYHIAPKHSTSENVNPLAPPPEMKTSVKLIDELFQLCDNALEFLLDQNDFLVVGCIGLQGVGKSTLMSYLAGNKVTELNKNLYFKPQTTEHQELGGYCTSGVDIYVSPGRVIFLDSQPILSPAVMDRLVQQEKKYVAEFASTENAMEVQSLQLAAFFLSVCHAVIFVQDWFFDPNVLRFLQSAEMLKPSTTTTSQDEEIIEYFPHVLFLHNHAQPSDFSPKQVEMMQNIYSQVFAKSRLQIQSGLGIGTGSIMACLTPATCGDPLNLFLLPEKDSLMDGNQYLGHPGFEHLLEGLKKQLLGVARNPLTHAALSEKNWFHYASKTWDSVKKSTFFLEYSRLLP